MSTIIRISPHLKSSLTVQRVMLEVLLALLPAFVMSVYLFRLRAVLLYSVCVVSSLVTEWAIMRIRQKPMSLFDGSALLTGILLAMVLPPSTPWGIAVIGAVVSIFIGKHIFGGLGYNIFNPALVGRAFLMAAFPVVLTTWILPLKVDAVTTATPLVLWKFDRVLTSVSQLFWGVRAGCLGETSAVLLLIGGVYLMIRKIADWRIPLSILGTVVVYSGLLWFIDHRNGPVFFHMFSGGLMLGAFFMATDPVTTPVTKAGRYIFGILVGFLVVTIRMWAGLPEGVMYAILFSNGLTPLINTMTKPKSFGRR